MCYNSAQSLCKLAFAGPKTNESSYLVFTSGCPADHVTGFKNGGLRKMLSECRSWCVDKTI